MQQVVFVTFLPLFPRWDHFHPIAVRIFYEMDPHPGIFMADTAHLPVTGKCIRVVLGHESQVSSILWVVFPSPRKTRVKLPSGASFLRISVNPRASR